MNGLAVNRLLNHFFSIVFMKISRNNGKNQSVLTESRILAERVLN